MTNVAIAAIAQPLAIHTSDAQSSFPQSRVGVNISIPATYLDRLRPALQMSQLLVVKGSSRHSPPPVSGKLGADQFVQRQLEALVERRRRLIEEHRATWSTGCGRRRSSAARRPCPPRWDTTRPRGGHQVAGKAAGARTSPTVGRRQANTSGYERQEPGKTLQQNSFADAGRPVTNSMSPALRLRSSDLTRCAPSMRTPVSAMEVIMLRP